MYWHCTPGKGIVSKEEGIELLFGAPRADIRAKLGYDPAANAGRSPQEDHYGKSLENPAHWIRLGFTPEDKLQEVEILSGTVDVDGVVFEAFNGDLPPVLEALKAKGYAFTRTDYGFTDFERLIDIGESGSNGAEHPDRTSWVYISRSFEHLKS